MQWPTSKNVPLSKRQNMTELSASASAIARRAIIAEQNQIIAAAYDALLLVRRTSAAYPEVDAVIERIENWRQRRDPEERR